MTNEDYSDPDEVQGSMMLAALSIILTWTALGGLVAWLCSSMWHISIFAFCAIYLVVSVIVAMIMGKRRLPGEK